jgi:hypothetical protein
MTLVLALGRAEEGITTARVEAHEQVGAIVAQRQGNLVISERFQVLILLWHRFRGVIMMIMSAHDDSFG